MTNYIEEKSNSIEEQHQKLVAQLTQIQQSISMNEQPSRSGVGGQGQPLRPPRRLSLYVLGEEDEEKEEEEEEQQEDIDVQIGDDFFLTENPFDFYSDEDKISVFYDSEGDDESRSYFPCPFCYLEIEVPVLCSHLQEEHCFDLKNAVCPLCAANLGKDATSHFIVQHSISLKRRRSKATLGKKLPTNVRGNRHEPVPDPLLSPFISNASIQTSNSIHQDEPSINNVPTISDAKSAGDEKDHEEKKQKAAFVQLLCLVFNNGLMEDINLIDSFNLNDHGNITVDPSHPFKWRKLKHHSVYLQFCTAYFGYGKVTFYYVIYPYESLISKRARTHKYTLNSIVSVKHDDSSSTESGLGYDLDLEDISDPKHRNPCSFPWGRCVFC
ncbi:protein DEHYDRATION-INDUCED 19-like protein 5-like [Senna tora]|uniref:Protein DEHYDRATION-INDUCED 19-like protein 5-like n=1 Tax=Senna tora TaxID=362788 RepID=A0A834W1X2_9FABA|nr:protein DEHYDRATION-INDUCED 19-like protein 5-like [Senna tora]